MTENIYKFMNKRQIEGELHAELLAKLDRCLEISIMLEKFSCHIDYKAAGDAIYHAFITIEDLSE